MRRDASNPDISSPSDTLTGSVFCMTVMGSLGMRPFRAYRLIWYSTSGERSLTTTEVWPTPTYTSCRLLSAIIGIICTLYPETCPIEGSQVTRMDFDATSRTWRFDAGSIAAESRILVWKWKCVSEICLVTTSLTFFSTDKRVELIFNTCTHLWNELPLHLLDGVKGGDAVDVISVRCGGNQLHFCFISLSDP